MVPEATMQYHKCFFKISIGLKKEKQQKKGKETLPDKWSAQEYVKIACKGNAKVVDEADSTIPESLLLHQRCKKDEHIFIPAADLKAGVPMHPNVYLYVKNKYRSLVGTPQGIDVIVQQPTLKDLSDTFKDKKTSRHSSNIRVVYWDGDFNTNRRAYDVRIFSGRGKNYLSLRYNHSYKLQVCGATGVSTMLHTTKPL